MLSSIANNAKTLNKHSIALSMATRITGKRGVAQQVYNSKQMFDEYYAYRLNRLDDKLKQSGVLGTDDVSLVDQCQAKGLLSAAGAQLLKSQINSRQSHAKQAKTWSHVYNFIAFPVMLLIGINCYVMEKEHMDHHDETLADYVPYPYLRVKRNNFPFGDGEHTLFHNDRFNYDPAVHGPRPLPMEELEALKAAAKDKHHH